MFILTDKARGNPSGSKNVHLWGYHENYEREDKNKIVRDFGVSNDISFTGNSAVNTLTYTDEGLCIIPSGDSGVFSRISCDPANQAFLAIIVGDWSQATSLIAMCSSDNGFWFAPSGAFAALNGLKQDIAGDATIAGTANITEFGGMLIHGQKNATLRMKTYVPGASVVSVGTATVANADVVFDSTSIAFTSESHIAGAILSLGAAFSVQEAEDLLVEYTDNLNKGIVTHPEGLL